VNNCFGHLPQSYLYRHAVKLFLKSGIVILHRTLHIPYGDHTYGGEPMVPVGGEWKPIHRVHSIAALYEHWKELIAPGAEELKALCKFKPDWTIEAEADTWFSTIEKSDPRNTYSR
jgi:hypothetical protein